MERKTPEPCGWVNLGNFSVILHAGIPFDSFPTSSLGKKATRYGDPSFGKVKIMQMEVIAWLTGPLSTGQRT